MDAEEQEVGFYYHQTILGSMWYWDGWYWQYRSPGLVSDEYTLGDVVTWDGMDVRRMIRLPQDVSLVDEWGREMESDV